MYILVQFGDRSPLDEVARLTATVERLDAWAEEATDRIAFLEEMLTEQSEQPS